MKLTQVSPTDRKVIEGYGAGVIRVSGADYLKPVFVFPDLVVPFAFESLEALTVGNFQPVMDRAVNVQILLFGSGSKGRFVPASVRADLGALGVVLESMDSGAACRTYNVLLAEGRKVAAAIVPG